MFFFCTVRLFFGAYFVEILQAWIESPVLWETFVIQETLFKKAPESISLGVILSRNIYQILH